MTDYTVETVDSSFSNANNKRARLAQSVEHQTFNLRVMGSSPISGERNFFVFVFERLKKMILILLITQLRRTEDLHTSKALFSPDPDNVQLHCLLGLGALFCCLFFCSLDHHVRR